MFPQLRKISSSLAWWALALICLASFALMFWAARTDSAIDDELAHIPAGYGYVSQLSYDLNPEHPPLVKALAMLPVLIFEHPNFPTTSTAWTTAVNGEWSMGTQFLYQSGNSANAIIDTARVFPILLTILTIILIYLLARRLMGAWWALLPSFLFAFDPTILAHGHYVTTDVGAAFGTVLSFFFFLRYLERPSTGNLWLAGLAFGIGQITKFSTPLVTVAFIFITLVLWAREMIVVQRRWSWRGGRWLFKLILMIIIGYVFIVYPVYTLFTLRYPMAKQVSDTTEILTSFANGPTPAGQLCSGMRCLADLDIWGAGHAVTRPYAEYLLGLLMSLQRSVGGNTIYFLGHIVNTGGWIYFPVLFLLKEPIPTLIILFVALVLAIWWVIKKRLTFSLPEFSLASFIVIYWGYSMHSPLNIGIRHILPTLPPMYILAAGVWKKWVMRFNIFDLRRSIFSIAAKYILLLALLIWLILEMLFAAPYFLSYFNEFGGGVWGGYHYVTDSNYDWGQDLLRLQNWVATSGVIEPNDKIAVDYFGGGDPSYYLGAREVNWSPSDGNPAAQGIHWLAVSVNQLQGAIEPLGADEASNTRSASDTYSWLVALHPIATSTNWFGSTMGNVPTPDYRIGTTIFVYKL
jgi:Dolichyl-phosphate-mannose-protein mannosyltransferase